MPFEDVMNTILPPQQGGGATNNPHTTGDYGEQRPSGPHGGVDFNYEGGQSNPLNQGHPPVSSPVDGQVVFSGGNYGTVTIQDADGNLHQVLHLDSQTVNVGDTISVGDQIGTMGGTGPNGTGQYQQHIHYQM